MSDEQYQTTKNKPSKPKVIFFLGFVVLMMAFAVLFYQIAQDQKAEISRLKECTAILNQTVSSFTVPQSENAFCSYWQKYKESDCPISQSALNQINIYCFPTIGVSS
jgi:hypothetical protein